MLLAIDSGNTNIVFAVYDGETRRGEWRSATNPNRTADEYAVWLSQLMALENLTRESVDAAIIANVVPNTDYPLRTLCRQYFRSEPIIIGEPSVDHSSNLLVGAMAKKSSRSSSSVANTGANQLRNAQASPGLMSCNRKVPSEVPSERQSSNPVCPSFSSKEAN